MTGIPLALPRGPLGRASLLGGVHLLVDAACVTAVWRTGDSRWVAFLSSWAVVCGYDLLAFAGQLPLGIAADRLRLTRAAALAGVALSAAALLLSPHSSVATLVAAGLGNALFHLGAGASVLRNPARATPAGLFVAPGALGLGLGMWMGRTGLGPTWPLLLLLLLALPLVDDAHGDTDATPTGAWPGPAALGTLALLFLSVMVRSYVGFGASHQCPAGLALTLGIPLAACAGKAAGGLAADRLGWVETGVGALLLSAPLLAFNGGSVPVALLGLVLFQMTMPVTLVATARLLPGRPATAFGLPCLALILGALPTFTPAGRFYNPGVFLGLVLVSAAALLVALRTPERRVAES